MAIRVRCQEVLLPITKWTANADPVCPARTVDKQALTRTPPPWWKESISERLSRSEMPVLSCRTIPGGSEVDNSIRRAKCRSVDH